jgi:hypothetical protein
MQVVNDNREVFKGNSFMFVIYGGERGWGIFPGQGTGYCVVFVADVEDPSLLW